MTEIYDPSAPTTNNCPFLPGQTVNILYVPEERNHIRRSASLTSLQPHSYRTMNPLDRYLPAKTASQLQPELLSQRLRTASHILVNRQQSSRSPSPTHSWKRFFSKRLASSLDGERGRPVSRDDDASIFTVESSYDHHGRCDTPSEGTRTRDISPESLRRFLCEDLPSRPGSNLDIRPPPVDISAEDIIIEEEDDDDNFATTSTTTTLETTLSFATGLSPPPSHRRPNCNRTTERRNLFGSYRNDLPRLNTAPTSQPAAAEPIVAAKFSLTSTISPSDDVPPFYDSNDEDDNHSNAEEDATLYSMGDTSASTRISFVGYSLPRPTYGPKVEPTATPCSPKFTSINSPQLLATGTQPSNTRANILGTTIEVGLDDFASELGWMVDAIGKRQH